jgi:hypothetical protein
LLYKLYVSPDVESLATAFGAVVGSLARFRGATAFKVGADAHGFYRPDKLVVYFEQLDDLQRGASKLEAEIGGMRAHGVPFSAAMTKCGLLSWGIDPPRINGIQTSWRQWVTGQLAQYMKPIDSVGIEAWQFALERLRLLGINTDTWVPSNGMWDRLLGAKGP